MPLRTDALVAVFARDIVGQNPVRNCPGSVLWIGQCVNVDNRGAERGSNVDRPGIVGNEQRRELKKRRQFPETQVPGQQTEFSAMPA